MRIVILGIALEVAATMFGTFGKQLISYSGKVHDEQRALRLKVIGLATTTLCGPLLDAAAYAFAPQSLVAPLNALDLVWNACTAPLTLGERLYPAHIIGTLLVFLGSTLSTVFGPHLHREVTVENEYRIFFSLNFLIYCIVALAGLLVSTVVLLQRPSGDGDWVRGLALAMTAGCLAGNMFFMSQVLGLLRMCISTGDWSVWQTWLPYNLVICALTVAGSNVPFMSRALQEYDALYVIPVFAGCQIMTSCISAATILQELRDMPGWKTLVYWLGVFLIMVGLIQITKNARLMSYKRMLQKDLPNEAHPQRPAELILWAGPSFGDSVAISDAVEDESDSETRLC